MSTTYDPESSGEDNLLLTDNTVFRSRLAQFSYTPFATSSMAPAVAATPTRLTRSAARVATPISLPSQVKGEKSPSPAITPVRNISTSNHKGSTPSSRDPTTPASRRKRGTSQTSPPSTLKKRRSTTKQRSANDPYEPLNNLVDALRPDLTLVFIGLNPGLKTAETGHAYAHPSNLFWKLLHESGVTPVRRLPSETHDMMDLYSIGNTNLCVRPTRSGDGLTPAEHIEGAKEVREKIGRFKPEAVCVVGKGVWEWLFLDMGGKKLKKEDFKWGWQDEGIQVGRVVDEDGEVVWPGARTFVTTSTSGLAASLRPHEKLEIWKPLGEWFSQRREEVKIEREAQGSLEHASGMETKTENGDGIKVQFFYEPEHDVVL